MAVSEIWIGDDLGNLSLAFGGIVSSGFFELDTTVLPAESVRYLVIKKQ